MSKKLLAVSMVAHMGAMSVLATQMTRGDYCKYRGWDIPKDEDPDEPVYLIEHTGGGRPNDDRHLGHITMSPKDVFESTYRANGSLTFGDALVVLKQGRKVARSGWNGKDQYVVAQSQTTTTEAPKIWNLHNKAHAEKLGGSIDVAPYCTLKTAQDTLVMGWVPSTGDLFAEDWLIIN